MKVTLLDFTGKGADDPADYAASLMIFTKSTRLQMSPGLLEEIMAWSHEDKMAELAYMANTIPSSWEFCDYTFMIERVSRAFTHQFVRSRTFSFAQQTMRVLDMQGWEYATGPSITSEPHLTRAYDSAMINANWAYRWLVSNGAAIEDARGVLPTNILTNIVAKCNMRTFVELVRKRSSPRVQGEYRNVLLAMQDAVKQVHPWISMFIERDFERAAKDLDEEIASIEDRDKATRMLKLVDQMRAQS